MAHMRIPAVLLSLLLAVTTLAKPVDTKAVDRIMTRMMEAWQVPGAAVAIVSDGQVQYVKGYGTRVLGQSKPVDGDTLFQIASTSKAFTATAVAMLASDGKLSFDDPVRQHLDYFRIGDACADSQVTIRDLLTHRTGVARHDELWDNTPLTRSDVVRAFGAVEFARPFRSGYGYQNITFIAAGEVVSKVAGMTWDEFVRTRIFRPLAMNRTITSDADWSVDTNTATGYRWYDATGRIAPQTPISTRTIGAGGGIKSSARDMAQWVRFQLDGEQKLLDPASLAETTTPHTVISVNEEIHPETNLMAYAMGWIVQDYRGEKLVSHAGALNGFRTNVGLLPEHDTGFVVLINSGRSAAVTATRNALADLVLGSPERDWNKHLLSIDAKSVEKEAAQKAARETKRVKDTRPTLPLGAYAGTYVSRAHGPATIDAANDRLVLRWNNLEVPLTHHHYDVFDAVSEEDWLEEELVFNLTPSRELKSFTLWGAEFVKQK